MVKLDKKLVLAGSTAMLGGYAGFFLVAPVLAYKVRLPPPAPAPALPRPGPRTPLP